MKNIILTLSLLACGQKPQSQTVDTTNQVDSVAQGSNEISLATDILFDVYNFPEKCSTIMENRDDWIAPKEKDKRVKFCDFVGMDQNGREIHLYEFIGEVVVLMFMDATCEECVAWLYTNEPYGILQSLKHEARVIQVITRNKEGMWASPSDVAQLHQEYNLGNFPLLAIDPSIIGHSSEQYQSFRNERFFPMFYLLDKDMRLAWSSTPYNRWKEDFHMEREWMLPVTDLVQE
jgi:hypothetical protein